MRPGKQDSNTISCIPKPHVGFESGNETRTIWHVVSSCRDCQISLTFQTLLLFLLWRKEKVRVNETSLVPYAKKSSHSALTSCRMITRSDCTPTTRPQRKLTDLLCWLVEVARWCCWVALADMGLWVKHIFANIRKNTVRRKGGGVEWGELFHQG